MAKAKEPRNPIFETISTVVWALLIAGVFRSFLFQPFWIPSGSMKETLLVGDFLFVNKMAYGYSYASCPSIRIARLGINLDAQTLCGFMDGDNSRILGDEPERGDVIVFRHPVSKADYVKRLIGLPGDKVQVINGVVHLNGTALAQEPAGTFTETMEPQGGQRREPSCSNVAVGTGGACHKSRAIETFPNGSQHMVLNIRDGQTLDNTPVYHVPQGHYFFMGDNRDNSTDSRVLQKLGGVGFVPYENLIGRADRVMFSSAGRSLLFFWTWRADRFFKAVN